MESRRKKKIITATLIVNPVSGKGDRQERRKLLRKYAEEFGWVGNYVETTEKKSARDIANDEIKKGVTHLVVCGGDGTIMEVLSEGIKRKIILGIIPLGTGNLLARNLSLPLDMREAMKIAFFGNDRPIDIGTANGTNFSIIAGIGLDADVMHEAKRELKDKWGLFAYVISTIKSMQHKSSPYEIILDKRKRFIVRAKTIMASNMGRLMGGVEVVPATDPQNGTLQLGIIKARSVGAWINLVIHALVGTIDKSPHYDVYKAKHIEVRSLDGKKYYECDGNNFPATERLIIDIYPKAVIIKVKPDVISVADGKDSNILLFDFDGTLADSFRMVVTIYNILAKKYHYPSILSKKEAELRGLNAREIINQLPISKVKLPLLFAEGKKEFEEQLEFIKPFPDLLETLSSLSKKYTMGIVTSNDSANVKKFLLNHNMDYFDFIYSDRSLFGKGKIIKKILKKYTFPNNHVVYIGDEVRDIDAARDAGIKIVSVTWGFNSKSRLIQSNPDFIIDTPRALLSLPLFKNRS